MAKHFFLIDKTVYFPREIILFTGHFNLTCSHLFALGKYVKYVCILNFSEKIRMVIINLYGKGEHGTGKEPKSLIQEVNLVRLCYGFRDKSIFIKLKLFLSLLSLSFEFSLGNDKNGYLRENIWISPMGQTHKKLIWKLL